MKGASAINKIPKTLFFTAEISQSMNAGSMQLFDAFEPNAHNHKGLMANLQANQLVIDARAQAVSTHDGVAAFSGGKCGGRLDAAGRDGSTADLRGWSRN